MKEGCNQKMLQVPSWELTYPIKNHVFKMIFLFPRRDMLVPWSVIFLKKKSGVSMYVAVFSKGVWLGHS